jgi:anti-anti-sigma regulatory factor
MLKIQRTADRATDVLRVSGHLDAANVSELCEALDATPASIAVVVDLTDLVLADREVVRLLREFETRERIVIRNCPAYIRTWMNGEDR